jgi:hypothetical protein
MLGSKEHEHVQPAPAGEKGMQMTPDSRRGAYRSGFMYATMSA